MSIAPSARCIASSSLAGGARCVRGWGPLPPPPPLPRTLRPRLAGRFRVEKVVGYPIVNTRLGEDTYSDGIMRLLVEFVRRQKSLAAEELDAWAAALQTP